MAEGIKHRTFDSESAVASQTLAYKNANSVHEVIKDITNFPRKWHSVLLQFVSQLSVYLLVQRKQSHASSKIA